MPRISVDAWVFAAKTYAAAMLALYLSLALDLARPGWAVTTVFVTCQPFSGATQSKAVYRFLGTLMGAAMSVAIIAAFAQTPVLLCLALAAWVAVCLAISLQDRSPRSYIFMLAGYTVAFIGFPAVNAPLNIFISSISRVEEILLGVLCSTCVHSIILPNSIMRAVWDRIDGWLRDVRLWSASALRSPSSEVGDTRPSILKKVAAYPLELDMLAGHLAYDTSGLRGEAPLLRALVYRLELLLPILVSIEDRLDMFRQQHIAVPTAVESYIVRLRAALAADVTEIDFAALQRELAAIQYAEAPPSDWDGILRAGLVARLGELLRTLRACYVLRRRLTVAEARPGHRRFSRRVAVTRHVDQGMVLLSSGTAFISILIACAVWIETGWADGGSAPMIAAVACSFFAAQDSPLPSMAKFSKFAIVAAIISLVYSTLILPRANSFEMAALMLAPVFIWLGLLIATPATSFIGMVVSTNLATLVGLDNVYSGDFIVTLNSALALVFGIALTAVIMSVIRVRTPAWSARRILKAARHDVIAMLQQGPSMRAHRRTREAFVHRMLDRLHVVVPRLGEPNLQGGIGVAALLPELRLGANAIDLHRLRPRLSPMENAAVIALTQQIAAFLQAQAGDPDLTPPESLRDQIDHLLSSTARTTSDYRQSVLLALSGMRVVLFRDDLATAPI